MRADELKTRLQGSSTDELVRLVADWILDRPLNKLVEPGFVADQVVGALEIASDGAQLEAWIKEQVSALRGQVPEGHPADQIPEELGAAIQKVISREYTPDRTLVLSLIDHPTMENLVRDILNQAMRNFTQKLKSVTPSMPKGTPKAGRSLGRLGSIGQSVLGGLGTEISQRAEQLATQTVDEALRVSIGQVATHVCDPANTLHYQAFRVHLWQTVIQTENRALAAEWDKLDPDGLVAAGTAASRALARREGLRDEVLGIVQSILDSNGERCLRDLLEETGLEAEEQRWRGAMEAQLANQVRDFVNTPGFTDWLGRLLGEHSGESHE
jgi:hypothetical protein